MSGGAFEPQASLMGAIKYRKAAVIGAGESGMASARLLHHLGARARVSSVGPLEAGFARWCLKSGIPVETGEHRESFIGECDLFVVSPGVKPTSGVIRYAERRGIPIWSEIELASSACRGRVVAVTGTNGKTTTSTLLWEMVRRHRPCHLCGNIGNSLAASVLEKGPSIWRVVEVSSFQMKYVHRFRPDAAAILNLSPNHLDWHPNLADYYHSKLRVASAQTQRQTTVINADDRGLVRRIKTLKSKKVFFSLKPLRDGFTVSDGKIVQMKSGRTRVIADLSKFKLKGSHNAQNALAAAACAAALGVPSSAIQAAINSAKPLPHRVEDIAAINGVRYINDSKSTTAMSTAAAVRGIEGGVILIAGGRRKQKSFRQVYAACKKRVSAMICYGESADGMYSEFAFMKKRFKTNTLESAVIKAAAMARPGQSVLLSPMCSSFDQFSSYRDRGDAFRRAVKRIAETRK